jgi:hypothetical protein
MNPLQQGTLFFKILSNITLQSMLRISIRALSLRYPRQNSVCISPPTGVPCLMTCHVWNEKQKHYKCNLNLWTLPFSFLLKSNYLALRGTASRLTIPPHFAGYSTTLLEVNVKFFPRCRWKPYRVTDSHTSFEEYCNRALRCTKGQNDYWVQHATWLFSQHLTAHVPFKAQNGVHSTGAVLQRPLQQTSQLSDDDDYSGGWMTDTNMHCRETNTDSTRSFLWWRQVAGKVQRAKVKTGEGKRTVLGGRRKRLHSHSIRVACRCLHRDGCVMSKSSQVCYGYTGVVRLIIMKNSTRTS